ncbi:MAG: hypothetical protein H7Y20_18565 [Bryobacteraceae bacterium]|nr:hypothetical protein [Bryobacteraceae bacterium]
MTSFAKSFAALLVLTASSLPAQQFATGQAARLVIGQSTFTLQLPGTSERRLGAVSGLSLVNDTLFVVDSSRVAASPQNNRLLIFPGISKQLPEPKQSMPWEGQLRCPVCGGAASIVLGQTDFTKSNIGTGAGQFRIPTAVASDGRVLAVADTDNNRVLIWLNIPTRDAQPADVVVGQPDFNGTSVGINFGGTGSTPSAKGFRGPQGLWIQDGKLFVADTSNNRVLIFNSIPRANGASADVVLGAPDFSTFVQSDLVQATLKATASNMLNPVSVTSDGTRLYITDLGHNRVLIWNSIPTRNATPVDVVVGQPDVNSTDDNQAFLANNTTRLCASNGEADGKPTYPALCAATLNFPRFALSDGTRLFISDGGNDRVLVYNTVPTVNGKAADAILGQPTEFVNQESDALRISAADSMRTPASLAWDGTNLYVSDPFNRRIIAFTPGDQALTPTSVRNAASRDIFALTGVAFTADPKEADEITLKIVDIEYKYKAVKDDKTANVIRGLVSAINAGAGDPNVLATPNIDFFQLVLTARKPGTDGNAVAYTVTLSTGAQLAVGAASGTLNGGQDAARIAPGTLVSILGNDLANSTASAEPNERGDLPQTLAGVEVYFDGIRAPLLYVSPTQINSQMPWEVNDSSSVSAYIRKTLADGTVRTTTAIAVPIIPQNPGIFAQENVPDPRPARAVHSSSNATGVVSVDGSIKENDVATVTIEDRPYTYTVKKDDTLVIVRDALIAQINQDEKVTAEAASLYARIILKAKVSGKDGEGVAYSAKANDGASVIVTALSPALCCASTKDDPITVANPAQPGEIITIYATGLGLVQPDEAKFNQVTGTIFRGPDQNQTNTPVDDAQAGGKTANVLVNRLVIGRVGLYEVQLQLNPDIPTNPQTQLWIAQNGFISNIVSFAVKNPNDPLE